MSLEQRCQQFHEAALGVSKSKGPPKEVATLRKFLHKNQDQRFTDKGVSRLFDTIQLYVHKESLDLESKEGLLEDALKMPFTVFTTKQKKSMIKWLEALRGGGTLDISDEGDNGKPQILSLIDIADGKVSLMNDDTGDAYEDIPLPSGDIGTSIVAAFETTYGTVSVAVEMEGGMVKQILGLRPTSE
jgi:hypothetical protein